MTALTEAIRREPAKKSITNWRGELNYILDDYQAALSDLNEAVRLSPDDVDNRILRSKIHRLLGNHEAAMNDGGRLSNWMTKTTAAINNVPSCCERRASWNGRLWSMGEPSNWHPTNGNVFGRGSCYHEMVKRNQPSTICEIDRIETRRTPIAIGAWA